MKNIQRYVADGRFAQVAHAAMLITVLTLTGCEKDELDRQMEALCAKDGGNKVYETVALPADMFSESGQPFSSVKSRSQEGKLGSEYIYLNEINFTVKIEFVF